MLDEGALFGLSPQRMPVLFVGHGSPMNAIEDNEYSRAWIDMGQVVPRPTAILCVSAHWETSGTQVTGMARPRTIHDFGGFPRRLFEQQYPAPGSSALAVLVQQTLPAPVGLDSAWGLDHGAWSVLLRMYPEADIPVVQLSLDRSKPPSWHYDLGRALRPLRDRGVLIIGSGNIVHNLRLIRFEDVAFDWAVEFDNTTRRMMETGDHGSLINYDRLGKNASLAIPTNEHYLPLLYALGAAEPDESPQFFAEGVTLGAISMRSVRLG